jgi:hypothetical protein
MSGRPEGTDPGLPEYDHTDLSDQAERDAFTPYRPSENTTTPTAGGGFVADLVGAAASFFEPAPSREAPPPDTGRAWRPGDTVHSTISLGGLLGGTVPAGTRGEVVDVHPGLLGDQITVRFDNGYTEDVPPGTISYDSGWH